MDSLTGTLSQIQLQDALADIRLKGCLLHNDPPDSDLGVALLRLIRGLEGRVRALDQKSTSELSLADHVKERGARDHELRLCRMALNSPIRCMPNELLACIFCHVPHKRSSPASVLKHVQVCQRWRAVALEEPQLWTQLTLEDAQAIGANAVEQVHAWFRRAHPLSVSLTFLRPWRYSRRREDSAHILHESILPHTPHISSLDIDGTYERVTSFTRLPPCTFPQLVKLRLNLPHEYSRDSLSQCSIFADLDHLDVAIPAPWGQLQELELNHVSDVHYTPQIFLQCKSLHRAILRCVNRSLDLPQPPSSPVEFVHLKTLVLQSQHWPDALLDAVLLPSLTTFDVQIGGFHPEQIPSDSWIQFMALVLRAPDLQSLTLRNINLMVHHIEFMSLLMCVPRLERLVLIDVAADPKHLLPLFYAYGPELVPQLKVLRFERLDVGVNDMDEAGPIYADAYERLYELLEYRDFRSMRGEFSIDWKIFDYTKMDDYEDEAYMLRDIVGHYADGTIIDVEDVEGIIDHIRSRENGYSDCDY
ncbi:hypothetical protein EV715DRAFT_295405 [Schizophyllum commune]